MKKTGSRLQAHSLARIICVLFLSFGFSNTYAEENSWSDKLSINGFYTADLTYSDSDISIVSNGQVIRPLKADEFTLKNSIFGLQATYNFSDNLSAYLQGTALYDRDDDPDAVLEWAYLSYDLGRDLTARLGQFQIPFLQGTELKSIGYSRLWVRPLVPGSGAGGFKDYIGVEFLKNIALQKSNLSLQVAIGKAEHELDIIDGKVLGLISARYSTRNFWIRAALLQVNYEIFTQRGRPIDSDASAVMGSIETEVEFKDFVINAGLSDSKADITPDDGLAYLSIAYRYGDFTPYILGKLLRQRFSSYQVSPPPALPSGPAPSGPPGLPPAPPPAPPAPPATPATPDGDKNTSSLAIGFRLDLGETYAIKLQLEHIDTEDDSRPNQGTISEQGNVFSLLFEGVF